MLAHYLANLPQRLHDVATSVVGWPTTALAWLGLALALWGRVQWRMLALLGFAALVLASLAGVFFLPRFAAPLVPVAALLAAMALLGDAGLARRVTWRGAVVAWLAVALLAGSLVPASVLAVRFHRQQQPSHLQPSIAFLRGLADADPAPRLMARKAHAAFLAGLPWQPYPVQRLGAAGFVQRAAAWGVDLVLVGPIEREYAGAAFDLADLDRLQGVAVVHTDSLNTIYRLDRSLPPGELGVDPALADARAAHDRALADGTPTDRLSTARTLARALRRSGDLAWAQGVLEQAVAAADPTNSGAMLEARVDLAWICLLAGDHAGGLAALEHHLAALHAHGDRVLEARAHEALGVHLLARGRTVEARQYLGSALAIFGDLGREADQRRVQALMREMLSP
jgi:tetratricopeptide (TPR) repeat protein